MSKVYRYIELDSGNCELTGAVILVAPAESLQDALKLVADLDLHDECTEVRVWVDEE